MSHFPLLLDAKHTCPHTHSDQLPFLANVSQSFVSNSRGKWDIYHTVFLPLESISNRQLHRVKPDVWPELQGGKRYEAECSAEDSRAGITPKDSWLRPGVLNSDGKKWIEGRFEYNFLHNQKTNNWRLNLSYGLMYFSVLLSLNGSIRRQ